MGINKLIFQSALFNTSSFSQSNLVKYIKKVEGQIQDKEQFILYQLAKEVSSDSCIVEIGSYRGKSSICLGLGSLHGNEVKVFAIDPHSTYVGVNGGKFGASDLSKMYKNITSFGLGEVIYQISLSSFEVGKIWQEKIGLLWIDGDHTYEGVKSDFELFGRFVTSNGYILFHDSYLDSVKQVINEILQSEDFILTEKIGTITVLKKVK